MRDLINRLIKGEGKMSLLLLEAREFIEEMGDTKFLDYVDNELNGYNSRDLPDYRIIQGSIVGSTQNPFGVIERNIPIGISALSEKIGIDATVVHINDGIGFIENNLENLSSTGVYRPFPDGMVSSLNEILRYNNPGVTLFSAAQSFGISSLQNIPSKVREELIKGLQNLKKISSSKSESAVLKAETYEPKDEIRVFVSYAWENEEQNDKVVSFVEFLRKHGYNASMDRMKAQEESSINFNTMMINGFREANKVVVILSPKYKERAESFHGGVGFEFSMILEELKINRNKYIFVSFGTDSFDDIVPMGILGREIIDLKKDQDESDFNNLFAKLQSQNVLQFSEVEDSVTEVKSKEIKPFKL